MMFILGGHKSNPDSVGTRLLTLCSNCVVSVKTSSSFTLSVRLTIFRGTILISGWDSDGLWPVGSAKDTPSQQR